MKSYFNNAIAGNSKMLCTFSDRGELIRLYWPYIDYQQQVDKFFTGIFLKGNGSGTLWMHYDEWDVSQKYIEDTNIVSTVFINNNNGIKIEQTDFVIPDKDVLIRQYEIVNNSGRDIETDFMVFSSQISCSNDLKSTLFDFVNDSIVHYRHDYYMSISFQGKVENFQIGNNAFYAAENNSLKGLDNVGMMIEGALSNSMGVIKNGERKKTEIIICLSESLEGVRTLTKEIKDRNIGELLRKTEAYWNKVLNEARMIVTGKKEIDQILRRTILLFYLVSQKDTGGILASPEIDEEFSRCGRYAYCWGRDAAFITSAFDICGLYGLTEKFYHWAIKAQDVEGYWHQRYYTDGNIAPSWGIQIDETGTIIWGMLQHYRNTLNTDFLEAMWNSIYKGAMFLMSFIDDDSGLPMPSYDIWEERYGEHAYSSAAVYGGLIAAAAVAGILGREVGFQTECEKAAERIKKAVYNNLWDSGNNRYLRSIKTKLNPWGGEYSPYKTVVKVNPKGYVKDVTLVDEVIDISLLGLCIPFGMFDFSEERIRLTVEAIEKVLSTPYGGLKRYENDSYAGGNSWIIAMAWAAIYHIQNANHDKALEYFERILKTITQTGLLPEQTDIYDGKPVWVYGLTWSHAMFVLLLDELYKAGKV